VIATLPKVWNKRHKDAPKDAVYVGRPTKWGNPYSHLPGTKAAHLVANRDEAVEAFERLLLRKFDRDPNALGRLQAELKGKDLVCWCAPKRCHADILLKYANKEQQ
jgi:hypothetical protein